MTPGQTVANTLSTLAGKKVAKTPEKLLEDALSTFTKAEQQLESALAEVDAQAQALLKDRAVIDAKIENATGVQARLRRIRQRVSDLLA